MCPAVLCHQEEQRKLLESEGVTFKADGCIDLKKHLWDPKVVDIGDYKLSWRTVFLSLIMLVFYRHLLLKLR